MSAVSFGSPAWWRCMLIWIYVSGFILTCHEAYAKKNEVYQIQSACKNHYLQSIYRIIDGAVLTSKNERNLDCVITFQTHSILQRFMLRFEMLQLDCNDHLYVYDGAHVIGTHKSDLTCRNTKESVASLFTRTNYLTLKYVTDNWGTDANGFKMIITAVKDPKHECKDFRCTSREFCISKQLVCDGVNHCGDGSDEMASKSCPNYDPNMLFGLELTWIVLIAVSGLLVISACIGGISICLCRNRSSNSQLNSMQVHQSIESNGSSKHHGALPLSGNLLHPAGPSGYRNKIHKLLMAKVRPIRCLEN